MLTIKIGKRGQITLPIRIRRRYGLKEGHHLAVIEEGDRVILRPISQTLLDLRGSVPVSEPQDFEQIRSQVIREHAEQVGKYAD